MFHSSVDVVGLEGGTTNPMYCCFTIKLLIIDYFMLSFHIVSVKRNIICFVLVCLFHRKTKMKSNPHVQHNEIMINLLVSNSQKTINPNNP
jgi:hypothetical protein